MLVSNCKHCGKAHRSITEEACGFRSRSEASFQQSVIRYARDHGWKVAHFHASVVGQDAEGNAIVVTPVSADAKGWPDLVMFRPGRRPIYAELKRELGEVTPEQQAWLELLYACGQVVCVWRPSMMKEIREVLR